ncbi:hypothetical protein GCM10015535_40080 [Streptomyces gelaticus]|uniref:Uncharacterized protein n=1 Tax=Streptomyces gelaticus TaxID=285446 RepID=A0ABQ2W3Y7_9ACTN|nr:hypothetical protein GCM10015535_40080 [Streptomyces gelaticus]
MKARAPGVASSLRYGLVDARRAGAVRGAMTSRSPETASMGPVAGVLSYGMDQASGRRVSGVQHLLRTD